MRNAGLERVRAIRQGARQLPQARAGCGANCPNEGDVVPSCSVDQPLWQFGSARWQIRQSAARHASRRVAWHGGAPRGGAKRVTLETQPERRGACSICGLHTCFSLHTPHAFTYMLCLPRRPPCTCQPRAAKSTTRYTHRSQRRSYMASAQLRHKSATEANWAFSAGATDSAATRS